MIQIRQDHIHVLAVVLQQGNPSLRARHLPELEIGSQDILKDPAECLVRINQEYTLSTIP
jgi:hypothetical protein